ncbi:MAG TPA: hypothetical protein VK735_34015 [Pseudonocardia sp.]|nr:hypothetical protein [Pseudonocardia sp.]
MGDERPTGDEPQSVNRPADGAPERGEPTERIEITVAELLGRMPSPQARRPPSRHAAPMLTGSSARRKLALTTGAVLAASSVIATALFGPPDLLGQRGPSSTGSNEPDGGHPGSGSTGPSHQPPGTPGQQTTPEDRNPRPLATPSPPAATAPVVPGGPPALAVPEFGPRRNGEGRSGSPSGNGSSSRNGSSSGDRSSSGRGSSGGDQASGSRSAGGGGTGSRIGDVGLALGSSGRSAGAGLTDTATDTATEAVADGLVDTSVDTVDRAEGGLAEVSLCVPAGSALSSLTEPITACALEVTDALDVTDSLTGAADLGGLLT